MKNKMLTKQKESPVEAERRFFLENVFFFVANSDKILSDPRMSLARVPVQNGLAYCGPGGFQNPTLGVYLEWWMQTRGAIVRNRRGKLLFYWFLSGSPLSGANACAVVDENGATKTLPVSPFNTLWRPFIRINTSYNELKSTVEAYSLQQVKEILSQTDQSDYRDRAYHNAQSWMSDAPSPEHTTCFEFTDYA